MHKLLMKKIAHAKKEHDEATRDIKGKCHGKSELHYKRCHESGKCHAGERKKTFCKLPWALSP
eukprot:3407000-Ditylum_brightwellii.AAC.1